MNDLQDEFSHRLHRLPRTVQNDAAARLQRDISDYNALPDKTIDCTPDRIFSTPITLEEIASAKKRAREHGASSAVGFDGQSYATFLQIPNDALQELANCCFDTLVGLESCILKMLTLIIDRRAVEWMEANDLLPDTQNGFRLGRHALNNPFIVRCAVDRAVAEGKALYVVFPDLTNAFPSTVPEVLWLQLYEAGMRGPMFD
ncbi:hypothetical protein FB107DRAFT_222565, partial [Schizophyllum commune]